MYDFMIYNYIGLVCHRIEHSTHTLNANKVIMNHYIFKCTTYCQKSEVKTRLIFSTTLKKTNSSPMQRCRTVLQILSQVCCCKQSKLASHVSMGTLKWAAHASANLHVSKTSTKSKPTTCKGKDRVGFINVPRHKQIVFSSS